MYINNWPPWLVMYIGCSQLPHKSVTVWGLIIIDLKKEEDNLVTKTENGLEYGMTK